MLDGRDISLLRDDVERNCRTWLRLCEQEGLNVLITSTVRDDEYQETLYQQGRTTPGQIVTNGRRVSFHKGFAFDFCKNINGHEYDDPAFFRKAAEIAKHMGFAWGGDWKSFPDTPHIQWDNHGAHTGTMILNGKYPPTMPEYIEEEEMTQEQFNEFMDKWLAERSKRAESAWSAQEGGILFAKSAGLMDGTAPQGFVTREQLAAVVMRLVELLKPVKK